MPLKPLCLISLFLMLPACGGPNIWQAKPHPLNTPGLVKIYTQRPTRYERLGTVTHLGLLDKDWQKRDPAPVFDDLLKEAAAMGANGLLLLDDTTMADGTVNVTYNGVPYTLPVIQDSNTVVAQGIFVNQK